ncbi:MAG: hypothetical protein AAFV93_19325 [Chloroflexota bacterium]
MVDKKSSSLMVRSTLSEDKTHEYIFHINEEIHELRPLVANRQSVQAMMFQLITLLNERDVDKPLLLIVNTIQSGSMPIQQTLAKLRELNQTMESKRKKRIAVALVHPNSTLVPMWIALMNTILSSTTFGQFPQGHEEEAKAWLLQMGQQL